MVDPAPLAEDEQGEEWTRFRLKGYDFWPDPEGEWVRYEDAASRLDALQRQLDESQGTGRVMSERIKRLDACLDALQAELEEYHSLTFHDIRDAERAIKAAEARADSLEKVLARAYSYFYGLHANETTARKEIIDEIRSVLEHKGEHE
jgi:chromosome condensin MukBEF ATPase and DNA-binding subunit MukB